MDSTAVVTLPDPAWQPLLSLLSPNLLVFVPLVILLTQGLLALPGIKRIRDFGFVVAGVVGIATVQVQAILETGAFALSATAVLHGICLGALASIGYKGLHEGKKVLVGEGPLCLLIAAGFGIAIFASGCSIPTFTRYAVAEAATSLGEARVGLDESRRDLQVDRDREADLQWTAYITDQADTFAKAARENPTPAALKDGLKTLAAKFRTERLAAIETNRRRTDERFRRVEQHMDFIAHILARLDTLARREESIQEQLAEYGRMAEQVARNKFGLPPAAPPGETPTAIASPVATPVAPAAGGGLAPPAEPAAP